MMIFAKGSQSGSPFGILCRQWSEWTNSIYQKERKGADRRKVTDAGETVLKSPAPVQKLDSPRLDDGCRVARLPAESITDLYSGVYIFGYTI